MTPLPTRLAAALTAQRARRGLGERRIRRRRLRGIPAVLPQLPPQLPNLSLKPAYLLRLRHNQSGQLLIRRTRIPGHRTMINELAPRSTSHAAQRLTSYEPIKPAAREQGISDKTLIESLHALSDGHYLNVTFGPAGNVPEFELTRFGYETGIEAVIHDVERIRRQVISALINEPPTGESVVEELAKQFDAPILVVEQILESLREQNLISHIRTLGGDSVTRVSPTLRRRIL
jgi:hypothetical protein